AAVRTTGGAGNFIYEWEPAANIPNGQSTDSVFNLTAGNYSVKVTDANGCDSTQTFTIQSTNSPYTYTDSVRNNPCFGQCDGYIEIIGIAGGVSPYSYTWSGPSGPIAVPPTTTLINNLCAGIYSVTISDATGCDSIASYTITEPAALNSTFNQNNVSCNGLTDGNAKVNVTGGTMPYAFTWEIGVASINDSIFNLAANTYRVTITDANNCTKTDSVVITEPSVIVVSSSTVDVLCNGEATGTATASATGGNGAPYVFAWNTTPPSVGPSITGLVAGTYIVTATDANNCTGTQTVIITEPSELSPTLFTYDVGCGAPNAGSAAIRATGGAGNFIYEWEPAANIPNGQSTDSVFNLAAGNYSVKVTDANGCDSTQTFTINSSSSTFTYTDSVRNDSCGAAGNGYIEIIGLSGGLAPYNFRWSNDPTNNTPINDNLVANIYSLTITDVAGCDSILSYTITEPPSMVPTIVTTPDTCIGGVGSAVITTLIGGTQPALFTWPGGSPPTHLPVVTGLAAGNYFVTITDANLCEVIEPFTIGNIAPFSIVLTITNPSCASFGNGSINVSASGATNPVTYAWDPSTGLSGANSGPVSAGNYPITVTDANGCAAIDTARVIDPLGLIINSVITTDETCVPGANGTAIAITSGGTLPYTYDWGNGPTSMANTSNLTAGNYSVTVRDANFCRWIEPFTINSNAPFTIDNPIITDAICSGDNNGSIQIIVVGAIAPITYAWPLSSGLIGSNPTSVPKGTYVVTVTDGTLCSTTATATVDVRSSIEATFSNKENESCTPGMDGFAVVFADKGVGPYTYDWSPSIGIANGAGTDSVFNLVAGSYDVTITDALMCTQVAPVTIDPAANIMLTSTSNQTDCFGGSDGSLTVSASGGVAPYSYEWFDMSTGPTKSNLSAGIYSITITDAAIPPCIKVESVTLGQPSPIGVNINTTIETCAPGNDAQATVTATGGILPFTYVFTGPGTIGSSPNIYTNLTEGAFSVLITDANGCSRSEPFNIISAQNFSLTLTSKDPTCANGNDGEFLVSVNGGANPLVYNWSGGGLAGADPKNVSAGTYGITVTDNFGCSAQGSGTLVDRAPIVATFAIIDESCIPGNDGAAKATASGGQGAYTYQWPTLPPSDVDSVINIVAGNYTVTITDDSACVSIIPFTIGSSAPFTLSEMITQPKCNGLSDGSITLMITGVTVPNSETYQWSPNVGVTNITNKNQSLLAAGTYLLTVTDPANGCQETETYIVGEPDLLEATDLIIPVGCNPGGNDGSIDLTPTGGTAPFSFIWSDNGTPSTEITEDRSNLAIGNYSVTITDANLCMYSDTYTIINQPQITITFNTSDVSCPGARDGIIRTTTNANNPSFTWSPPFPNVPDLITLPGGKYYLTVTDGITNCFAVDSVEIDESDPIVSMFTITDENCFPGNDGVASASSMGGTPSYTYSFSGGNVIGNGVVDQLAANTYTVTVTDQRNCSTIEMFTVGLAAPFTSSFISSNPICQGDSTGTATITVTNSSGPVVFAWPPTLLDPTSPTQNSLPAGTYNVTISDPANGCSEVLPIIITEPDTIKSNAVIIDENCNPGGNGSIDISPTGGDMGPYTYVWSPVPNPVATLEDQTGLSAGKYFVTITDVLGCSEVDSFIVQSIVSTIPNLSTLNDGCSPISLCAGEAKVDPQGGVSPYSFSWSGPSGPIIVPSTRDSIGSLCAGLYSLTITDASGCDTIIAFTINPKRTILPNTVVIDEMCNAVDNGEISVTPIGGQEPYTYDWSIAGIPTTDSLVTGLAPGPYSVTITDATGCDTIVNTTVGTENFNYSLDSTDISCNGTNDGRVDITIVGGSTGFIFNWSSGTNPTSEDQANLSAGKYLVTITNTANGCTVVDSTVVNPKTSILPNEVITNESCNSFNDGKIVLTPTGGAAGSYSYRWVPNVSTSDTAKNLAGGVYNVTISDALGCDTILSVTIQSTPLITATIVTQDLSCATSGVCNGKAYVTPANGIAPYNYNWGLGVVTGMTPDTAINLCLGNYNVTITDAGGCKIVENFTIGGPAPIAPNFTVTSSTCNFSNGQLSVNPTGGSGTYTVEWFDAMSISLGTSTTITSLASGVYSIVIIDNTGCSSSFNTAVNDIGAESVDTSFTDVTCFNGNDGTATASFVCNDPGCTVEWFTSLGSSIATTNTATGLVAGDYYVEVTNNSGCKAVKNVTISQPTQFQIFSTVTDNICGGGAAGSINLNVSGGTGSYSYVWSPAPGSGQNTNSVGGLLATTYSVIISDGNLCDSVMTFTITEPQVLSSVFTTTDANCNQADGRIVATVSGGTTTTGYDYQWFDATNNILVGETFDTLKNIASGNYSLRVRDDNACERRFNVSVNDLNGPTVVIDSTRSAGCFGESNGAIFITASGNNAPFIYNWLPNGEATEDITNLSEGSYSVKVTDAVGCKTTAFNTIQESSELMATITVGEATCGLCNGTGSAIVTGGTTPYNYLWSNGDVGNTADSLCGGNYTVVVTDASGCSKAFDFGVNTIGGPTGETVSITPASCANSNDGSATVTPIGGTPPYSYLWQHNGAISNTLSNLTAGTYFLQISDVRSCSRTVQIDITSPPAIIVAPQVVAATCNTSDGSILLNVSGGQAPYSFNWGSGIPDVDFRDNLAAGIYSVIISDANGCMERRNIALNNTGVAATASPSATDVSCYGLSNGSLVANVSGAASTFDYRWFFVQGPAAAAVNTDILSSAATGDYVLEITTNPLLCKSFYLVTVGEPDSITLSSTIIRNVSCNASCDGEVFINTRGGNILYSYSWDDLNNQQQIPASGLCAGTYSVTATDANGCTATTAVTLTDPPILTANITSNTNLICSSDCDATATSISNGGTPPYIFNWNGGQVDPNPTNLCFGMNILTVTDARNCSVSDTIFVSAIDTVVTNALGNPLVCDGDSVLLKGELIGNSITSFGWYFPDSQTLLTTTLDTGFILAPGNYSFYLKATSGSCSDVDTFKVVVAPNPVIGISSPLRIFGDNVARIEISNEDLSYIYRWTPSTNLDDSTTAEPITTTRDDITYTVLVTDTISGCTYLDSVVVNYSPNIQIPSGFTPNGDGTNDVWDIEYLNAFPNAAVQIYNRWGTLLYETSNGYVTPWDGKYEGNKLPIGTYYYIIDLKDTKFEPLTGPVTIVK
ncbi:MAG: gliding motility-associated C-terminal domain-containing protein, partial [Flavobacteriales bacterium]|nr:gliding motility-associated C-terminal domain-containing protein [Flavobacteriales bacterium]